ncbi:unnamed protein product [Anisakis simplex]|uniref:Uncharacterized protein n=1 Tax=Anisakis simplex TaxID=6269 RepID=A0A3P6QJ87_ANISI|nr:unnamed protein product [Anisakis simplex]
MDGYFDERGWSGICGDGAVKERSVVLVICRYVLGADVDRDDFYRLMDDA